MINYKGIFYNDKKEKKYYEFGAHFKYKELVFELNKLIKEKETTNSSKQSKENILIFVDNKNIFRVGKKSKSLLKRQKEMNLNFLTMNSNTNPRRNRFIINKSSKIKSNIDDRGSFTELLKTNNNGQFSVNISKPGITKGQHWHHSKWEFFIVVKGHALIQERKIGTDEVIEFDVSDIKIEAVHMLPGYTHNIINLSDKEDLITLMWANELFDSEKPDTYFEEV